MLSGQRYDEEIHFVVVAVCYVILNVIDFFSETAKKLMISIELVHRFQPLGDFLNNLCCLED